MDTLKQRHDEIEKRLITQIHAILEPVLGEEFRFRTSIYDMYAEVSVRTEVAYGNSHRGSFSVNWDTRRTGIQIWNLNPWNGGIEEYPDVTAAFRAALRIVDRVSELNEAYLGLDFDALLRLAQEIQAEKAAELERQKVAAKAQLDALIAKIKPGSMYLFPQSRKVTVKKVTRTRVFFEEDIKEVKVTSFVEDLIKGIVILVG